MVKSKKKSPANASAMIAQNRKAFHDYSIEERFEAGLALLGWEVKSIRAGRVNLTESYILLKHNEVWWIGGLITPLPSASTHIDPDPTRTRKLLLNAAEIRKLIGSVERKGYSIVPLKLYWKRGRVKLAIALAKGKKKHDKRAAIKEHDWARQKERILRDH